MQKIRKPKKPLMPGEMDKIIAAVPPPTEIEKMPLTTYEEYKEYNAVARRENKRLGMLRYPCKQCPVELHPHERVIIERKDQPTNPFPAFLSNHLIHFDKTLVPGKEYDLPRVVINYLVSLGRPNWKIVEKPDGSVDTYIDGYESRFSIRSVFTE